MKIDHLYAKSFNVLLAVLVSVVLTTANAEIRPTGFKDTDALVEQANSLNAAVLAPKSYGSAEKYYRAVQRYAAQGKTDSARKQQVKMNNELRDAIAAAKVAQFTFADVLKSRERAIVAETARFEPALWMASEELLIAAATKLERNDQKGAQSIAVKAGKAYMDAELAAIKTGIVGNARVLLAEADADPNRVERNAPITLAQAISLVAQAEAALDMNRYQLDEPKALAAEAEYQAKHAMYLAEQVAMLNAKQITGEELILNWEKPLRDIAGVLAVTTDMTRGYAAAGEASMTQATRLMAQNSAKNERINALEVKIGDSEQVIQRAEQAQQKLQTLESLFAENEARVLLEGNDVILRMTGLSFPTGQATIETRYFSLLAAVQKSLGVFPESYVIIEGHTDSQGDETKNLELSQRRANSVRTYLIANAAVQATKISAEGYGESRPVATNVYEAGRAQNRRIDIVLKDAWAGNQATARLSR